MLNRVARGLGLFVVSMAVGGTSIAAAQGREGDAGPSAVIRDGFEGPKVVWRQEQTDAPYKIFAHDRTRRAAHEGLLSEGFSFEAGIGGGLYYSYALPQIPVTDDLNVGLFVRSNREGVQLLGRVVLPEDIDPDSGRPSFVLVPGTTYEAAERWQKVELTDMPAAIERQARVLRASTRRKVSLKRAYLERLVVNIYGGQGETEVYLDELTISPVTAEAATEHARMIRGGPAPRTASMPAARTVADRPRAPSEPLEVNRPGSNSRIRIDRNRLSKDGFPWFPTAIRAPDADPALIRRIGCDLMVIPRGTDEEVVRAARASGLFLIPELNSGIDEARLPDADQVVADAMAFAGKEDVFAWSIGENLGKSKNLETRRAAVRRVRDAKLGIARAKPGGSPFTTGTVVGMLPEYSKIPENLDLIGIPAMTWATTQGPYENFQYLEQRRLLTARSNADATIWAEVDVTAPPIYQQSIWGTDRPPAWGLPRVQPEQVAVATFAALAAGCRGIVFRADGDLSQGPGRMATIEMALLNEVIDLLEPILADPDKSIQMRDTYLPDPPPPPPITLFALNNAMTTRVVIPKEFPPHPTIKAAAISTKDRRGTLLMIADYVQYGQFQPPQSAINKLKLLVPAARDAHAYLISPGGVRALDDLPGDPGGHKITLEDFGVTAIVLVTTNVELKDQIEQAINKVRPFAVSLAIEQAELQRAWVAEIDSLIQDLRHPQKDSYELIAQADALIKSARDALEREDYQTAWEEARRVGRPLRILMRYHFMAAYDEMVKILNDEDLPCGPIVYPGMDKPLTRLIAPIVAAPLASFSTLPQAWTWIEWIRTGRLGRNAIATGSLDFENLNQFKAAGWTWEDYQADDVQTNIATNKGGVDNPKSTKEGGSNLAMMAGPRKGVPIDSLPPFVDHPLVAIRSPAVPVRAGEVYRISVMAFMPRPTAPGAGGIIVRDSVGGERLQFRTSQSLLGGWYEIVYYRRIPVDGKLDVLLGLAGYGLCTFDDLKVEPIIQQLDPEQMRLSVRPRRRPATTATAAAPSTERTPPRAAARPQPTPFRQ